MAKILFVLCALTTLSLAHPSALSREISVDQSPQLGFSDVIDQIRSVDISRGLIKMVFRNPEETISTLTRLMTAENKPAVSEVLDVFNYNIGARLLVVNGEYIEIDPIAYQQVLSDRVRDVVRSVFPQNLLRELVLFGLLETPILRTSQEVNLEIGNRKVPVEKMTALIASEGYTITKRNVVSDLVFSFGNTMCSGVVNVAYNQLNSTLNTFIAFLDGISVNGGGSDNILGSLVGNLTSIGIDVCKTVIFKVNEIAESVTSSICSDLLNSTTTRSADVASLGRLERNTDLTKSLTRDVAIDNILTGLWDVVWSMISGVLNTSLMTLISSGVSVLKSNIDSLLDSTIVSWASSIVNSIFPANILPN